MSSDETPKIEPTLIINDAPSIAAVDQPPAIDAKAEIEPPKADAKIEPKAERIEAKIEPKTEPKTESKVEAPTLPPAPQLTEPPTAIIPFKRPEPKGEAAAAQPRSRFALLAACVAIAASFGAIGGSLGVAKFGPMVAAPPPAVAAVTRDNVADEVKALTFALFSKLRSGSLTGPQAEKAREILKKARRDLEDL